MSDITLTITLPEAQALALVTAGFGPRVPTSGAAVSRQLSGYTGRAANLVAKRQ